MADSGSRSGRSILLVLVGITVLIIGCGGAASVIGCFGLGWAASPMPELAELPVEPGVAFTLEVPASEETGRDVWLDFDLEYDQQRETPWGLEGTVTIAELDFELDLGPGGEGIVGFPSSWEDHCYTEAGFIWAETSGDILLGTVPPGVGQGQIAGTILTRPGTYANGLRLYVRE